MLNYMRKPLNSLLVKPAGPDCNMECTYCFYREKESLFPEHKLHRMSLEILEEMVRQMMMQGGTEVSFTWQGGEPTLMGLSFYRKAVEFQKRYGNGQVVGNALQTNGLLIEEQWAKFFKEYNFLIGLSLDGPQHVHDRYRFLSGGRGSWKRVVDTAKLLLDAGVAVNALTVLNDYSVQFPEEIYNFHKELGLTYMQFIPCLEKHPAHREQIAAYSISGQQYGNFLKKIFDLWMADFVNDLPTTYIRFFDSLFYRYVNLTPPDCWMQSSCGVYLVVEHNGDVYSCDFFVEPRWKLGNLMDSKLIDLLNSPRQWKFAALKSNVPEKCRSCKWLNYCWGGCTKDRIQDPGDEGMNHFCEAYLMFFEYADSRFKQLAKSWQLRQKQEAVKKALLRGEIQVGRNDPCPCGSGKKFKKCCGIGTRMKA